MLIHVMGEGGDPLKIYFGGFGISKCSFFFSNFSILLSVPNNSIRIIVPKKAFETMVSNTISRLTATPKSAIKNDRN